MSLPGFSIRRPVTVSMAAVALTLFGLVSFGRLDLNLLPDISYPSLTVETRYRDAAPLEVESLVTRRVEESLGVISGVERLVSVSRPGLSRVTLEFSWGTDMDFAALDVREKLDRLRLPQDSERPRLLRFDPRLDPIMRLGLTGGEDLASLRRMAEDTLKKELEGSDGVAAVRVTGGLEDEIHVDVDEAVAMAYGVGIQDVSRRLAEANVNQAGGSLYHDEARYLVRTLNEFADLEEIGQTPIKQVEAKLLRLEDIAEITRGTRDREVISRIDGHEGVILSVYKEGDSNTVRVAREVQRKVEQLELSDDYKLTVLSDQSRFIANAVNEVISAAALGGLIAVLVLFLFLGEFRTTLAIGLSIPVSVVTTFFLMYRMGITLNVMSLGGLALGVGMLVDSSVVVLESIVRQRERGKEAAEAAEHGANEVGRAVVVSILTTVCVFLPIVFVEGVAGQLFRDQAWTVTFSLLASLLVSLTLIPTIMARLGRPPRSLREPMEPAEPLSHMTVGDLRHKDRRHRLLRALYVRAPAFVLRNLRLALGFLFGVLSWPLRRAAALVARVLSWLETFYAGFVRGALARRAITLLVAFAVAAGALYTGRRLGVDLIPPLEQGSFTVVLRFPEGTPLELTTGRIREAERVLLEHPAVERVEATAGLVKEEEGARESEGVLRVRLKSLGDEAAVVEKLREKLVELPNIDYEFVKPTYFTFSTPVAVEVYGDDLDVLRAEASRVAERMRAIEGLADVVSTSEAGNPEIHVLFERDRMARMGLEAGALAAVLRAKVRGNVATRLTEGDRPVDIVVRASQSFRDSAEDISELSIAGNGKPIRLKSVADTRVAMGPAEVRRLGQRRAAVISASLVDLDLRGATHAIEGVLDEMTLAPGVVARLGGQNRELSASYRSLYLAIALATFLVYVVMASLFESFLQPLIILVTVPLGFVGAIFALALTGTTVSVVALIGAVMLAGIVVNNAIVLVDKVNRLRDEGLTKLEALIEAGRARLRPILMTTTTTILALMPMALSLGEGAELRAPLAVTVIGGLAVSTLLTLVVVPTLYSLLVPERRS